MLFWKNPLNLDDFNFFLNFIAESLDDKNPIDNYGCTLLHKAAESGQNWANFGSLDVLG